MRLKGVRYRFVMAVLVAAALTLICMSKSDLGVVMLYMANHSAERQHYVMSDYFLAECAKPPEVAIRNGPLEFTWRERSVTFSGYYIGSLLGHVPGLMLSEHFDCKWVLFGSLLVNAALSFALPSMALHLGWGGLLLARFLLGFCAGPAFPAAHVVLSGWAAPGETLFILTIVYAGAALGAATNGALLGPVCWLLGWRWGAYLPAALTVPWLGFWVVFAEEAVMLHPHVTASEHDLIVRGMLARPSTVREAPFSRRFPWRGACCSWPYWAILLGHVGNSCACAFLLCFLPQILMLCFNKSNLHASSMAAVAYFCMWTVSLTLVCLFTWMYSTGKMDECTCKKVFCSINTVVPAACLLVLAFVGCRSPYGELALVGATAFMGALSFAYTANPVMLAPNFAGTLVTIASMVGNIGGIFIPLLVAGVIEDTIQAGVMRSWNPVLYVLVVLLVGSCLAFVMGVSCEVQPWNEFRPEPEIIDVDLDQLEKEREEQREERRKRKERLRREREKNKRPRRFPCCPTKEQRRKWKERKERRERRRRLRREREEAAARASPGDEPRRPSGQDEWRSTSRSRSSQAQAQAQAPRPSPRPSPRPPSVSESSPSQRTSTSRTSRSSQAQAQAQAPRPSPRPLPRPPSVSESSPSQRTYTPRSSGADTPQSLGSERLSQSARHSSTK